MSHTIYRTTQNYVSNTVSHSVTSHYLTFDCMVWNNTIILYNLEHSVKLLVDIENSQNQGLKQISPIEDAKLKIQTVSTS